MSQPNPKIKMMQGNVACAEGAIAAGCRFFAGYPITPSSEIAETMSLKLPALDGNFIQMEDEIGAMGAVIGSSLVGVKSLTATSGPGFSLKQENIGFAAIAEIPVVIINVQRGGPSTGLPTKPAQGDVMQSRWGTHGDHPAIVLCPSSVEECYFMTIRAFNLSEEYRTPVIVLSDEIIGHLTEKITIPHHSDIDIINRLKPQSDPENYLPYENTETYIPAMANFGEGYRYHVTGLVHDETGFPTNDSKKIEEQLTRLYNKIEKNHDKIIDVSEYFCDDMDTLIIAYGAVARSAKQSMLKARQEGHKVGLLKLNTIWPFPEKQIVKLCQNIKRIIVPEMNFGQLAHEIEWATRRAIPIIKYNKINGEPITPLDIYNILINRK